MPAPSARARVASFIGGKADECVFVRGATEGINLVAHSFAGPRLKPGDRILSVGGRAVGTPAELVASMDGAKAGVPVKVEYLREGKTSTVEVTPQTREMRVMVFRRGENGP